MVHHKKIQEGQRYGNLTVVRRDIASGDGPLWNARWLCKCDCGRTRIVRGKSLQRGRANSCGCRRHQPQFNRRLNLAGRRFGRLRPISFAETNKGKAAWNCQCECGRRLIVETHKLTSGNTKSCGCLKVDRTRERSRTHGMSRSPEYNNWIAMRNRCYNRRNQDYKAYGGRGIRVCRRWRWSFENFLADMGKRPMPRATIERKDPDGNYSPKNCRWATQKEQTRNKRTNRRITIGNLTLSVGEWAERTGTPSRRIVARLELGWSPDRAVMTRRFRRGAARKKTTG